MGLGAPAALPELPGAVFPGGAPALPSTAEPGEPEEDWLALLNVGQEELAMLEQGGHGFGAFAALIGRAWLASARRRVHMTELADTWAYDVELLDMCQECERQEDPEVLEGDGAHGDGLQLKIHVVADIPALIAEFEEAYSVPEFPLEEDVWRAFLERNDSWKTLCLQCRRQRKGMGQPSTPSALPPAVPPPALSDSPGSDEDTPAESDKDSEDQQSAPGVDLSDVPC
jgi:hypothetical protein